jgi:Uma2 family endonuclease
VVVVGEDLLRFEAQQFEPVGTTWMEHVLTHPPTLVIESLSQGHEHHDQVTKRKWYADLKVPHYWIIDGFARRLECLRLRGEHYDLEASGAHDDTLEPASFPGLRISLREVWES